MKEVLDKLMRDSNAALPLGACVIDSRDSLQVGSVSYERQPIADHAINLASTIQLNLKRSLEALGVVRSLDCCNHASLGYPRRAVYSVAPLI